MKEIASVIYFPRNKSVSTSMVIERLLRLDECFDQVAVFLCGKDASFPYISDRIHSKIKHCQIYLYDVARGSIRTSFRTEVKNNDIKI